MPSPKKMNAIISQITPQTVVVRIIAYPVWMRSPRDGQQPQISANALASEVLTLRRMVSSSRQVNEVLANTGGDYAPMTSHRAYMQDMTPTNST
jgi:hypothetical protein